ncbi:hypothetical protein Trydic_g4270 [Trypoxylus dichotomus]
MVRLNCKETYKTSKYILLKTGMWPKVTTTKCELLSFAFTLISDAFLLSFSAFNIINEIRTKNFIKLLNWLTSLLIPAANYTAKGYTLIVNKKCFYEIVNDIENETFNSHSEKLNRHIQLICNISQILLRYFAFALGIYLAVRSFLPIVVDVGMIIPPPFDMGEYDILYRIFHFFATVNICVNTAGFDVLFLTLMAVCVAQLHILEDRLRRLYEDALECSGSTGNINEIVETTLRECVILHNTIYR